MKTPVIIKDDYTVYYELVEGGTFVHCDMHKWNKTVKENFLKDVETLKDLYNIPLFTVHTIEQDDKHIKFLKMCGWKYLQTETDINGNPIDFYVINEEKRHG